MPGGITMTVMLDQIRKATRQLPAAAASSLLVGGVLIIEIIVFHELLLGGQMARRAGL